MTQTKKEELATRVLRAKRVAQHMRTLDREGVLYTDNRLEPYTREEYKKEILRSVTYQINMKVPGQWHRRESAIRAADIVRNGRESEWYFARSSKQGNASDPRGIVHNIVKYKQKIFRMEVINVV